MGKHLFGLSCSFSVGANRFKDLEPLLRHSLLDQFEKSQLAFCFDWTLPLGLHFILHASSEQTF
jgi:hypothetical protein